MGRTARIEEFVKEEEDVYLRVWKGLRTFMIGVFLGQIVFGDENMNLNI